MGYEPKESEKNLLKRSRALCTLRSGNPVAARRIVSALDETHSDPDFSPPSSHEKIPDCSDSCPPSVNRNSPLECKVDLQKSLYELKHGVNITIKGRIFTTEDCQGLEAPTKTQESHMEKISRHGHH